MTLFRDLADVSVRPAVAGDDAAITAIQVAAWRHTHDAALGEGVIDRLDVDVMRDRWKAAVESAPGAGFAVLVAMDGPRLVGFASIAPGQIMALEVDPDHRRAGHGSRLLAAAVDRLRAHGADELTTWVLQGDTARERFLGDCGLGPDGTERTLATGPRTVVERRWSASI